MHQTVNAIMMESRVELFNHNILILATHSSSPLVPVRILSTSEGHHPCPNHFQLSQPYIPAFSPHDHLMFTSSISTSWVPYPLASCPDLNPCELCQDPSFNHHSLFHPYLSSQADHHPYGPDSFHTSYPIYLKALHSVTIMFLFPILSPHLNLITIHMVPTRYSKHQLILPNLPSTANQPSGPSPAQLAPSRSKCFDSKLRRPSSPSLSSPGDGTFASYSPN